ncbi:response regulator [Frigoriglobus tundricola]|uniref:Chemotaxis protein methyltransferase CheR n=1 Tax=Frigoriglobus tundricola TaxID=2774151 RepID=A0A6M5YW73_9BACT|nr:response regulator [Frigoriglobus tundricola]QJW98347.1 Chemotaxis protein methyltransferase CheR [Frigoriglobus tundricola]
MADKKYRVLVVDDNRDSAESMADLLALSGFEVRTCFDGPAALTACETFRPEACLLDINMPGMDGYELARLLRARFAEHPPVFATMTAYGDHAHLERAVEAGFDLQFTKPVDSHEVTEQLGESVRKGEPVEDDRSVLRRLLARVFGQWSQRNEK